MSASTLVTASCRQCSGAVVVTFTTGGYARLRHESGPAEHAPTLRAARRGRVVVDHGDHLAVYLDRGPNRAWVLVGVTAVGLDRADALATAQRWTGGAVAVVPARERAPLK